MNACVKGSRKIYKDVRGLVEKRVGVGHKA